MPVRLSDLARALRQLGVEVIEAPGGGSHYRARKDGRVYPIPAHNGLRSELSEVYVRGVCRAFGLDEDELRRLL